MLWCYRNCTCFGEGGVLVHRRKISSGMVSWSRPRATFRRSILTTGTASCERTLQCLDFAEMGFTRYVHRSHWLLLACRSDKLTYGFRIPTDVRNWQEHLCSLDPSSRIGLDPTLLSVADFSNIKPTLTDGRELIPIAENLVDLVWENERPARPSEDVFVLDEKYAGVGVKEKIENVREELKKRKEDVKGLVVSMLDEICCEFLPLLQNF